MKISRLLFLTLFIFLSCDNSRIYDDTRKIPESGWSSHNQYKFEVNISDTSAYYDINIHMRNYTKYEYSNIWLFIESKAPNGNFLKDTVEFFLADETGKWLGKGLGDINTMLMVYKENVRFPYRGVYQFSIDQAMRKDPLENILDIGLQIKEHKN